MTINVTMAGAKIVETADEVWAEADEGRRAEKDAELAFAAHQSRVRESARAYEATLRSRVVYRDTP